MFQQPDAVEPSPTLRFCVYLLSLQVPSSRQLLFGHLLWAMTMAVAPAARAALLPAPLAPSPSPSDLPRAGPTDASSPPLPTLLQTNQPQHLQHTTPVLLQLFAGPGLCIAVLSYFVMVVLPYMMARAWERTDLRPRYAAYLASAARGAVLGQDGSEVRAPGSSGSGGVGSGGNGAGSEPGKPYNGGSLLDAAGSSSSGSGAMLAEEVKGNRPDGGRALSPPPAASAKWHRTPYPHQPHLPPPPAPESLVLLSSPSRTEDTGKAPTGNGPCRTALRPANPVLDLSLLLPADPPRPRPAAAVTHTNSTGSMSTTSSSNNRVSRNGGSSSAMGITGSTRPRQRRPLYGGQPGYEAQLLSVEVPRRRSAPGSAAASGGAAVHGSSFRAASAQVLAAAEAVLSKYDAGGRTAGQSPAVATSSLDGTQPRVVPLTCVCVEGCVHLLLVVRAPVGRGPGDEERWESEGRGVGGMAGAVRHRSLDMQHGDAQEEGYMTEMTEMVAAVEQALGDMLAGLGEVAAGGGGGDGGGGALAIDETSAGGLAAVWPPAVPLVEGGVAAARGAAGEPAGPEEEGSSMEEAVEVVVACGASLLRGLGAVRCVAVGHGGGGGGAAAAGVQELGQHGMQTQGCPPHCVYLDCVVPVAPAAGHGEEEEEQRRWEEGRLGNGTQEAEFARQMEMQGVNRIRWALDCRNEPRASYKRVQGNGIT